MNVHQAEIEFQMNKRIYSIFTVVLTMTTVLFAYNTFFNNQNNTKDTSDSTYHASSYKIGLVKPDFTYTAYLNGGFYDYYRCVSNNSCKYNPSNYLEKALDTNSSPTYLPWFNFKIPKIKTGWDSQIDSTQKSWISSIHQFKKLNVSIQIISDLDVHNNVISQYNLLIFFHNEYVTLQEYENMIDYIRLGGNVIIMNGNSFYAEIVYHKSTTKIQLVNGHNVHYFENNESYVYNSKYRYGFYNTSYLENYAYKYIGSRYSQFYSGAYVPVQIENIGNSNVTSVISSVEENTVINPNVKTIVYWKNSKVITDLGVQTYEFNPFINGGRLIHMGLYSTWFLTERYFDFQNLILRLIIYQLTS